MQWQIGDTVSVWKSETQRVQGLILNLDASSKRVVVLVKRLDTGMEDVWAWSPAQHGVSVFKVGA